MRVIDADLLMDNLGFDNTAEEREENVEMENNTVNNFTITGIGIARK